MSEINMDFSFPAAPSSSPTSTSILAPPFGHSQRPLSFSPQPRPRKHAHRRSAAMSEDLKATDLSVLTAPQLAASSVGPSRSPSSMSLRSNASGASSISGTNSGGTNTGGTNASATNTHAGGTSTSTNTSAVTFAPLPQVPQMPTSARESSPMRRSSFDLRDSRSRMQFAGSPSSPMPLRRLGNVGEPGQLVPASPTSSLSPLPSPREESVRQKPKDRSKRRSFVRVFRRSRDLDSGGDDTLIPQDSHELEQRLPSPTPQLSPPEAPRTPEISSPILTPRNSGEVLRELEPEPPSIDLDEALSCSFEHRKPEGILESPFSKASSIIGPVPEEEEESDTESLASSHLRQGALLHKANSVHSSSSFSRSSGSLKPISRPVTKSSSTAPILLSPGRGELSSHERRQYPANTKGQDQLSHLAIVDPKVSSSPLKQEPSRPTKGHARRRSLISRIMGRNH